jgi:hypothetical protein
MSRTVFTSALLGATLLLMTPLVTASQSDRDTPEGTEWHLVSFGNLDQGEYVPVPWQYDLTLSLASGRAEGSTGCN